MNETELVFTEILHCNRLSLYLNKESSLGKDKSTFVSGVLKRRITGEPIQYILGKQEFMGLEFKVDKNVFIPRPETEILVGAALRIVREFASSRVRELKILDLGTGSGCIAVSLTKYLSDCSITATDISQEALNIAKENAEMNNVANRIKFLKSNLFESLAIYDTSPSARGLRYAICVCNPPYIPTAEIEVLQPEIKYEPRVALDGGREGLDFYRKIVDNAPHYLKEEGFLIMEMGYKQKKPIENIFQKSGNFEIIDVVKDYNNIDRVIVAKKI